AATQVVGVVSEGTKDSEGDRPGASCRGSPAIGLPTRAGPPPVGYATVTRRRRARDRFVKAHGTKSQLVFFASPRYRTLDHPKIRLITKNTCSTFARTFDLVRLRARSASLRGRWR